MDISKHISSLFFQHECVIVPGLGGFVSNYHPAKIHPVQHLFQPPSKTILFNPELRNNDGLLTNAIAEQEKISYQDALAIIDNFARKTLASIQSGSKVELNNIGVLYSGVEGNILFQQDEKNNYLKHTYGLSSFVSPMISRSFRAAAHKPATKFVNRHEAEKPNKSKRVGAWALFVIPLFIVLGWISMNTDIWNGFTNNGTGLAEATKTELNAEANLNDKVKADNDKTLAQPKTSEEKPTIIKPETASFVPELSNDDSLEETKDDVTEEETRPNELIPDPVVIPPAQVAQQKMYHLIGGSFEKIDNAESLIVTCKEQGYENPMVIGQASNGFYRVSITAYARKSEAINELQKVRASLSPQAWLLRQ